MTPGGRVMLALVALLTAPAACAEEVAVPVDWQERQIELTGDFEKPDGSGPFPAVILLHGCSGNDDYARHRSEIWAELLHQQGYATLILDSFSARGVGNICSNSAQVPYRKRADDIFAAAYLLAARADVRADRIAAMGFSHGGGTALDAAVDWDELKPWRERLASRGKLVAVVGFYPGCRETEARDFVLPVLVLVGDRDDWTPARYCFGRTGGVTAEASPFQLDVYAGATHDFDVDRPPRVTLDHRLAYDPEATEDARREVATFLRRYLKQ